MCRHRRLAHGCGVLGADPDESSSDDDEVSGVNGGRTTDSTSALTVLDIQQSYFAGVARNIANNLDYHIEGKSDHLARATSHIKWRQPSYTAAFNAVVTAENNSSPAVSLEQFNFPRGFTMKPMCDLYEERVAAETGDESASAQKDSSPIQVPDVRMCHVCKAVFHSTAELEEHVLQSHDSNASESSGADAEPPTLVAEQPLDLRSPVMNSIQSADDATGALVIPLDKDSTECTDLHSTAVFDKTTQPADVERKLMCLVCFGEFEDTDTLIQHQSDRHANIDCRHIEVDKNYFPAVSGVQPKVVGLLNVRSSQLPATLGKRLFFVFFRMPANCCMLPPSPSCTGGEGWKLFSTEVSRAI
jgi:hypothetical protein